MPAIHFNGKTDDFKRHLVSAAQKAAQTLPELNGRLQRAVDLVLAGAVTPGEGALVRSQTNPEKQYKVTRDSCECMDFLDAPEGWCKHRLTWALYRRAWLAIHQEAKDKAAAEHPERVPTAPTRGQTEEWAEATVCLKARRADGREVSWTFRGTETQAVAWFETRNAYLDTCFGSRASSVRSTAGLAAHRHA